MNITLEVTVNDVQTVLGALAKLPLEQAADPFFKIKAQTEQQIAEQKQAEAAESAGGTD
jgi:hypothetical protein